MLAEREDDELRGLSGPSRAGEQGLSGPSRGEDALWAEARCNDGTGGLVALFYSEQLDDVARAKAICAECPVRELCFEAALARREPYGVWGGRLFFKGRVLAFKRPRGRPPKNAEALSA